MPFLYREARASGGDPAMAEQIQQRMDAAMTKYLTIKAALLEPETLRLMMEMTSATCDLLVQVEKKRSDTLVIMYSAVQLNVGISCVERGLS